MQFGILLCTQFAPAPPEAAGQNLLSDLIEQVQAARDLGFDSIWATQHYLGNVASPQPIPLLARLCAAASPMTVGTAAVILPLHHPVEVAELLATLDHISGGRTVAGVGLGYRENEYASFGIPMAERTGRLREGIDILRGLWRGQPFSYAGKHFRLQDQTIGLAPLTPGGPPIWVGATAEPAVRRAAALGDAWIITPTITLERMAFLLDIYRGELATRGLSLQREYPVLRELCLRADGRAAVAEGRQALYQQASAYAKYGRQDLVDQLNNMIAHTYLFCDPETCIARLRALAALGITYVILRAQWPGMPQSAVLQTLRMFAEQVRPHFASPAPPRR